MRGARVLKERLEGKAEVDIDTARRLFTPHLRPALGVTVPQKPPSSVLFCCDHNSVRSPMAEGLMKKLYGRQAYVQSAGVKNDREIDGFTVAVCQGDRGRAVASPRALL